MPVALISTRTSPALGPSRSSSTTSSGFFASNATAARVFIYRSSTQDYFIQELFLLSLEYCGYLKILRRFANYASAIQRTRSVARLPRLPQRQRPPPSYLVCLKHCTLASNVKAGDFVSLSGMDCSPAGSAIFVEIFKRKSETGVICNIITKPCFEGRND